MLITPPETVAHNRGPMDCYVCPPEVLFSCIPPHVICTWSCLPLNKGNNKITELRTILRRKVKTHNYINRQISQQPENCENCKNRNDPDLVQAFPKKWWVESDFKAPNLLLSLRFKGSGCHCNSI